MVRKHMLVAVMAVGAAILVAVTAGEARAQATHVSFPISSDTVFPAGTICDFAYEESFAGTVTFTLAPNGLFTQVVRLDVTHTNLDTGYMLTEHDVIHDVIRAGSSDLIETGIFWHLRDSSGRTVLVKAGEAVFDLASGQLIRFTPDTGLDQTFAGTLCPLLGGSPA
jgi:hypothetical protein